MEVPLAHQDAPPADDCYCARCGYNLRGLDPAGRCPECGEPVVLSHRSDLLRFADAGWLRRMRFGAGLIIWSEIADVVERLGTTIRISGTWQDNVPWFLLEYSTYVLLVLGTFFVTVREPRKALSEGTFSLRKWIRGLVAGNLAVGCVAIIVEGLPAILVFVINFAAALAITAAFLGLFLYIRQLAMRIPDAKLAKRATLLFWYLATTKAISVLLGLALLLGTGDTSLTIKFKLSTSAVVTTCVNGLLELFASVFLIVTMLRYFRSLTQSLEIQARWRSAVQPVHVAPD